MTDRLNKSTEAKLNRSYKSFDMPHPKTLSKSLLLTNQKRISWALDLAYPFRYTLTPSFSILKLNFTKNELQFVKIYFVMHRSWSF